MEIALIQVLFFTLGSKQKNMVYHKNEIPWHLHTINKSALLKTTESHFSFVWVIDFITISSCLGKVKVFPTILASQA